MTFGSCVPPSRRTSGSCSIEKLASERNQHHRAESLRSFEESRDRQESVPEALVQYNPRLAQLAKTADTLCLLSLPEGIEEAAAAAEDAATALVDSSSSSSSNNVIIERFCSNLQNVRQIEPNVSYKE